MSIAFISLGSNIENRSEHIFRTLKRLHGSHTCIQVISRLYETAPVGDTPEPVPAYLNCVVKVKTDLEPLPLLDFTQSLEKAEGRKRTFRWGPRCIDLDILLYDDIHLNTERLILPHPRIYERAFVLTPLLEIEPALVFVDGIHPADLLKEPALSSQRLALWHEAPEPAVG